MVNVQLYAELIGFKSVKTTFGIHNKKVKEQF